MGRILILEPQPDVRDLWAHVAERLGHESVTEVPPNPDAAPVDVIVLEPDGPRGLAIARALRERFPEIRLVCASTVPPTRELRRELSPHAYLTKPFPLAALERALADAFDGVS
jgi:CheY-like chemotaxis protein